MVPCRSATRIAVAQEVIPPFSRILLSHETAVFGRSQYGVVPHGPVTVGSGGVRRGTAPFGSEARAIGPGLAVRLVRGSGAKDDLALRCLVRRSFGSCWSQEVNLGVFDRDRYAGLGG